MSRKFTYTDPFEVRLLDQLFFSPSGCFEWQGKQRNPKGYGRISYRAKAELAHRAAYMHFVGAIPDGFFVLHSCDNPPCCNPDHLFLGTPLDNMHDMIAKGRAKHPRGESAHNAKLTEADARAIYASKESSTILGRHYGVASAHIDKIRNRLCWRHIHA